MGILSGLSQRLKDIEIIVTRVVQNTIFSVSTNVVSYLDDLS